jgi:hypothetical protein
MRAQMPVRGTKASNVRRSDSANRDRAEGERQGLMKQSDIYRQNAENCMQMAEAAEAEPAYNRFKRMEAAWLALAEEQDWLDGEQSRVGPDGRNAKEQNERQ